MQVSKSENQLPIKMWLKDLEEGAFNQAQNLAKLPFAFKHIAIMPDSHQGYGMPIGGVLATKRVVIPNAVGVDIGCGMCAVRTSLIQISQETLKKVMGTIRKEIPVGFNKHKKAQDEDLMPRKREMYDGVCLNEMADELPIVAANYSNALLSLGTLGGGNHFIEIQKGDDGHIWIMIHSGSRNLGLQVANHYNKIAKELNRKMYSIVPVEHDLAFLPLDSPEGKDYLREMQYCVDYALANRKLMMERVKAIFVRIVWEGDPINGDAERFFKPMINIAHNYATMENHFGENVMVHRKGATLASSDTTGIIPGSQGTKSYIVRGLGNPDSFNSCSHGAGRRMGRKQAEINLDLEKEVSSLDKQGILHSIRGVKDLDEAPGAYKPIDEVMDNQKDLVEILVELTPLGVVKG